jgi:pimeloyl-ACP methyl ester carboxylesterase
LSIETQTLRSLWLDPVCALVNDHPVRPETQYAKSGGVHIAYQVVGDGPIDLVWTPGWVSNTEAMWEIPPFVPMIERLASFSRLIIWDKRGTGLSDPVAGVPTLDERMDDLRAVMDAAKSRRAALFGVSEGGPTNLLFAATYPERTQSLILYGTLPRFTPAAGFECGWTRQEFERMGAEIEESWGRGALLDRFAPSAVNNEKARQLFGYYQRTGASPGMALALWKSLAEIDVRSILGSVHVPTLILHRTDERIAPVQGARYMAERIPGARLVELPGDDHIPTLGDTETMLGLIEEFLTGHRRGPEPQRVLTTVLFTDIVGSTARAAQVGDRRWRELLDRHDFVVRRQLERFRGTEIDRAGDGFLASFDGPARAVQCALAAVDVVRPLGIEIRAGVHTGECEKREHGLGGIAVHIGARVAGQAGPGQVLVSRTVKELVVGSGLRFSDRGEHSLKGIPDSWQLFGVSV